MSATAELEASSQEQVWLNRRRSACIVMFEKTVNILVTKENVRFSSESKSIDLYPIVFISSTKPFGILSIGDATFESEIAKRIDLFSGIGDEQDKVSVLEEFFRYGIRQVRGGPFSLSPKVSLEVGSEVESVFLGYHRLILHYCLTMAGARSTPYDGSYSGRKF